MSHTIRTQLVSLLRALHLVSLVQFTAHATPDGAATVNFMTDSKSFMAYCCYS